MKITQSGYEATCQSCGGSVKAPGHDEISLRATVAWRLKHHDYLTSKTTISALIDVLTLAAVAK